MCLPADCPRPTTSSVDLPVLGPISLDVYEHSSRDVRCSLTLRLLISFPLHILAYWNGPCKLHTERSIGV